MIAGSLAVACAVPGCAPCDEPAAQEQSGPEAPASPEPSRETLPGHYFPGEIGDRWRIQVEPGGPENAGVSGVEPGGVLAVFGTAHAVLTRFRPTPEELAVVDPEGRTLVPLLRSPLERGARWRYEMAQPGGHTVPCDAEVTDVGLQPRVSGAQQRGCVEVRRVCTWPEAPGLAPGTRQTLVDRYCPGVGRIEQRMRFEPPPTLPGIPAERVESMRSYRITGAPTRPAPDRFDCDALLLLPTDVSAACGPGVSPVPPSAGSEEGGGCTYVYAASGGRIEVRAAPTTEDVPEGEPEDGYALVEGGVRVDVTAEAAACPEEGLRRLEPLLRSLVR